MKRKKSNRILLHVFIVMLLFANTPISSAKSLESSELSRLCGIGVIKTSTEEMPEYLTRHELAKTAALMITGGGELPEGSQNLFYDDAADEYLPYIDIVTAAGFMSAINEKSFGGENTVTKNQLAKVMVCVLGYDEAAKGKGGYPEGYNFYANKIGIFDDTKIEEADKISTKEAIKVFCNVLDKKSVLQKYPKNEFELSDKTLLEENFGLYTVDGVLVPSSAIKLNNEAVINDVNYELDIKYQTEKDIDLLSGRKVRAYLTVGTNTIVYVDSEYFSNYVFDLYAQDIEYISGRTITYTDSDGKKSSLTVTDSLTVIYNGLLSDNSMANFKINDGYIRFIKNGSSYASALIYDCDTIIVGNTGNNRIYDYFEETVCINLDDYDTVEIYGDDGKMEKEDIKCYDVIRFMISPDRKKITLWVTRNVYNGKVVQLSDDTARVGKKELGFSLYYEKYSDRLKLGDIVTVYMDSLGRIAGIRQDFNMKTYGYFINAGTKKSIDGQVQLKLLTQNDEIEIFDLADKVKINGNTVIHPSLNQNSELETTLKTLVDADGEHLMHDFVRQPILYNLNQAGEITYIDTALMGSNENELDNLSISQKITNTPFKSQSLQFIGSFGVAEDSTKLFYVPFSENNFDIYGNADAAARDAVDENSYKYYTPSKLVNDVRYNAVAYNVSGGGLARLVLIDNVYGGGQINFTKVAQRIFIVSRVNPCKNKNGEDSFLVSGCYNGELASYAVSNPDYFTCKYLGNNENYKGQSFVPQSGDIIQIELDENNEIASFRICYNKKNSLDYMNYSFHTTEFGYDFGTAFDSDEYGVSYLRDINDSSAKTYAMFKGIGRIYLYDEKEKKASVASTNDIITLTRNSYEASFLYCRDVYGTVTEIVIYKNEQ